MRVSGVRQCLEFVGSQGGFVPQVVRLKLSGSLTLLQNQVRAENVFFLGVIWAQKADYYLAFTTDSGKFIPAAFYCSQDQVTWFALTSVSAELRGEILAQKALFTGALIHEMQLDSGRVVNEEQRVAAVVADIAEHCLLIPRGFALQSSLGLVLPNPVYQGAAVERLEELVALRHWSVKTKAETVLDRAFGNPALDFLEDLTEAEKRNWQVVLDTSCALHLKSLRWPGFEMAVFGDEFANAYFGHGLINTVLGIPLGAVTEAGGEAPGAEVVADGDRDGDGEAPQALQEA